MNTAKDRSDLKQYFIKNATPTEQHFATLIDSSLNFADDGLVKDGPNPLTVVSTDSASSEKPVLSLAQDNDTVDWTFNLQPRRIAQLPSTANVGLGITDHEGKTALFVERDSRAVGLGTLEPEAALHVHMHEIEPSRRSGLLVEGDLDAAQANQIVGLEALLTVSGESNHVFGSNIIGTNVDLSCGDQPKATGMRNHVDCLGDVIGIECELERSSQCTGLDLSITGGSETESLIKGGHVQLKQPNGSGTMLGLLIEVDGTVSAPILDTADLRHHKGARIACYAAPGEVRTTGLDVHVHCGMEHSNDHVAGAQFICKVSDLPEPNARSSTSGSFFGALALSEFPYDNDDQNQHVCGLAAQARGRGRNRIGVYSSVNGASIDTTPNLHPGTWAGWFDGDVKADLVRGEAFQTENTHPKFNLGKLNLRVPESPEGMLFFSDTVEINDPTHTGGYLAYIQVPKYAVELMGGLEPTMFITPDERVKVSATYSAVHDHNFIVVADEICTISYLLICRRDDAVRHDRYIEHHSWIGGDRYIYADGRIVDPDATPTP